MPRSRSTLLPLDVMSEPEAASARSPERLRPRRPKTPVLPAVSIPAAWRHPPPLGPPAARHRRLPRATPRRRPRPAPIRPSHRRHPSCARVSLRRDSCRHRRPRPSSPGRLGRCPRCTPPRQPLPGLRRCGAESRARRGSPPCLSKTIPSMNSFELPRPRASNTCAVNQSHREWLCRPRSWRCQSCAHGRHHRVCCAWSPRA